MEHFLAEATDFWVTVVQPDFLNAIGVTLYLSLVSSLFAILIGFLAAFLGAGPIRLTRWLSTTYVEIFRNTPLLIQLYIYYKGLQNIGITLDPVVCGILGLSLYTGAYLTEVFRAGLLAVPQNQTDAGLSLGLNRFEVYGWVLVPQAIRIILPALCNQLVSLAKNSSLVAFITVEEIFYRVYKGAVDEFQPMKFFLVGALLYVSITLAISILIQIVDWLLEKRVLRFPALLSVRELREGHA